jgi:DNA-binding CsgD family transcriptional regulator
MRGGRDPIDVIEAAYRLDGTTQQWLDGLIEPVQATLDQGLGVLAWSIDLRPDEPLMKVVISHAGMSAEQAERILVISRRYPTMVRVSHDCLPVTTLSQNFGRAAYRRLPDLQELFGVGFVDCLGAVVVDPESHCGAGVGALLPRIESVPRAMAARWSRVTAHLGLALRARLRLERPGASDPVASADAVVSPGGKIEHAERDAREPASLAALRAAARAVDRARGRLRRSDPDEAVEIWKGLVSGRWSLVDHSDSDGRRFLIARRNDPAVAAPVALDARDRRVVAYRAQGHPLKLIAYELGISIATVSASLSRARAVLGLRDEDFARALVPPATASGPKGD